MSSSRDGRDVGAPADTEAEPSRPHVLVVDNYDSFTYNLVEYVSEHAETTVLKNTASLEDVRAVEADAIIVSPGPGHPKNDRDVGVSMDVIRELRSTVPILGVCLGLEAAVYALGGTVDRAPAPIHGKASPVSHDGQGVFSGLEQGFQAGRYHSLVAVDVPDCLEVTATANHDGESLVMGVRHADPEVALECVQFHPESVLTAVGHDVIENFLDGIGSQNGRTSR
ncbi:anthranilate synthase component II [Saliphagus sp. GCM10025317]